jgi:undecaprenyl-diphosphatase
MDSSLLHYVIQLRRPWLDDVMLLSSAIGAGAFIWWVTAVIAAVFPEKRAAAWRMILAISFTWAVSEFVLKPGFDRPRPYEVDTSIAVLEGKPDTRAFPSGHAAMSVAGAVAGSRLIPYSAWFWWPFAAVIAVSRVYLGVHWPSDVIAGALLGLITSWFVLGGRMIRPHRPSRS